MYVRKHLEDNRYALLISHSSFFFFCHNGAEQLLVHIRACSRRSILMVYQITLQGLPLEETRTRAYIRFYYSNYYPRTD